MKFKPLHDRVLVKRVQSDEKTAGGIIIPDTAQEKPMEGEVLETGSGARDESGKLVPLDVKKETELLNEIISEKEIKKRKDLRSIDSFTIDPDDAKDFDDALSVEKENDTISIGIHIADVSHFFNVRTKINKEAEKRATSVYLVDRTIPMLPEKLSNNLCSLKPNVDRLTY